MLQKISIWIVIIFSNLQSRHFEKKKWWWGWMLGRLQNEQKSSWPLFDHCLVSFLWMTIWSFSSFLQMSASSFASHLLSYAASYIEVGNPREELFLWMNKKNYVFCKRLLGNTSLLKYTIFWIGKKIMTIIILILV